MIRKLSILKYALLLLLAAPATAQTTASRKSQTSNPSAVVGDKIACYNQAQAYVGRQNKESTAQSPSQPWTKMSYMLDQAHYDAKNQVCYLQMGVTESMYPPDSRYHATLEQIIVVDAFEGKTIASFTDVMSVDESGKVTWSKLSSGDCDVNGVKCSSREEFNGLLWKLIPALQPVDCHVEENGISKPCKKAATTK